MATIANQIKRISDSRDLLRSKGRALGLQVPAGNYWDDATNTYIAYNAAALGESDQIDKIAAAFNAVVPKLGTEIKVPITVTTDGTTTTVESYVLDTGFYANATIVPFIKVNTVDDIVINVEMVSGRVLTSKTGTINPSQGFNYIGQFGYTITSGAVSTSNAGYGNNYVTAKIATSGWVDKDATTNISVTQSTMTSKVGSGSATTISSGATINPNATSDTTITINKGIYGSNRTLTVKSVASQTAANATAPDILNGKTAWVNGIKITGTMPNYGGNSDEEKYTAAESFSNNGGKLAIQPALGYYNDYSTITTNIVYNPTRIFNTSSITTSATDTMSAKTYYETIPAGYYHTAITRKITVRDYKGSVKIDYTNHKATFDVTQTGWISNDVSVDISAGPAVYRQTEADLTASGHAFVITPAKDIDGTQTSYLTQVTVDNKVIFDLLAAI
jgi:hypothetical protein